MIQITDLLGAGWFERETWLQREHPDIHAARSTTHPFQPSGRVGGSHVCSARCICARCWEPRSERVHPRRKESARA